MARKGTLNFASRMRVAYGKSLTVLTRELGPFISPGYYAVRVSGFSCGLARSFLMDRPQLPLPLSIHACHGFPFPCPCRSHTAHCGFGPPVRSVPFLCERSVAFVLLFFIFPLSSASPEGGRGSVSFARKAKFGRICVVCVSGDLRLSAFLSLGMILRSSYVCVCLCLVGGKPNAAQLPANSRLPAMNDRWWEADSHWAQGAAYMTVANVKGTIKKRVCVCAAKKKRGRDKNPPLHTYTQARARARKAGPWKTITFITCATRPNVCFLQVSYGSINGHRIGSASCAARAGRGSGEHQHPGRPGVRYRVRENE